MSRLVLGLQLPLHDDLGGDACVVGSDHPVRVVALHPVVANERVHQGLLEGVPHVERPRYIGRRQLNTVGWRRCGRRCGGGLRLKQPARFPDWVPAGFDGGRLKTLGERIHAEGFLQKGAWLGGSGGSSLVGVDRVAAVAIKTPTITRGRTIS